MTCNMLLKSHNALEWLLCKCCRIEDAVRQILDEGFHLAKSGSVSAFCSLVVLCA